MKKLYLGILIIGLVLTSLIGVWAVSLYFHSVPVDLTVSEARSSADLSFSLICNSGETITKDLTISNAANVPLNAKLLWVEDSNIDGVIYTTNLPMEVALAPLTDTIATISVTCDPITPVGQVNGTINYEKIA